MDRIFSGLGSNFESPNKKLACSNVGSVWTIPMTRFFIFIFIINLRYSFRKLKIC